MKLTQFFCADNYQRSLGRFPKLLCYTLIFVLGIGESTRAQRTSKVFTEVRSIETGLVNLQRPEGITFSPEANAFLVLGASTAGQNDSDVILIDQLSDDRTGLVTVSVDISNSINIVFDSNANRLLMLQSDGNTLFVVNAGSDGEPGTDPSETISTDQFGLENPQGIAVDSANGNLFILDSSGPRILNVIPGPNGDLSSARTSELDLSNTGLDDLRGIVLDPASGNLQIMDPEEQRLFEISPKGVIVANHDLSFLGAFMPHGMVYAPSGDRTDDPSEMNLYIAADNGADGQIIELSLTESRVLANSGQTSSTPAPGTLIQTIDTSGFDPPSPDSSGISYNGEELYIVDGEVNEIVDDTPPPQIPLFDDATVFVSLLAGTLDTTFNISTMMTDGQDPPGENPPGTLILFPNPPPAGYSDEPTGITYDAGNNVFYISDDSAREVWRADATNMNLLGSFDTLSFSTDPEGIAFNPTDGSLYIAGGADREVYIIAPNTNGFDGLPPTGDDQLTSFDTSIMDSSIQVDDPEGIAYDPDTGHLYLVGVPVTEMAQVTTDGNLVRKIDISAANPNKPAGLVVAPRSTNASLSSVYIADRGDDNDSVPGENDGMVFEIAVPPITPGNTAPVVDAGPDDMVTIPDVANLDGTVNDDGLPDPPSVTTLWSVVSGPGTVTFGDDSSVDTTASFSSAGSYVLSLSANDGELEGFDTVTIEVTGGPTVVDIPVVAGSDDAEERATGGIGGGLTSGNLDIANKTVGMRFINVGIPQGSTIVNAFVQFTVQSSDTTDITTEVPINGEAVDNPSTFINVNSNITDRPLTTATINWDPPSWPTAGEAGVDQRTPNIAPVIQEIVNRPGWTSGNALVIILGITGDGQRRAASFEDNRDGPVLHIEFTEGGGNFFPMAVDDSYTVAENSGTTTLTPAVTANDNFGGDGASSTAIVIASGPSDGTATVNDSGTPGDPTDDTIDYTPNTDFDGTDSLTYIIEDSNGDTDTATVTIEVTAVNDVPTAVDDNYTVAENSGTMTLTPAVTANDSFGGDGASSTAIVIASDPGDGTATVNDSGTPGDPTDDTIDYTPNTDFDGTDSLTYTIEDSNGDTDTATVTIEVTAANDVPTAVDDNYTVAENSGTTTLTPAVTANDSFGGDGASSTAIVIASDPGDGTATVNDGGTPNDPTDDTIDYTPNTDFDDTDSLTYTIEDSNGDTSTATVNITVNPVGGDGIIEVSVSASSDDAEERLNSSSNRMILFSNDLELVDDRDNNQIVGTRFNGLDIPNGATITNAFVQFQVDEVNSDATSITIQGEAADNAGTFTSVGGNISSRPLTAASVEWMPNPWDTVGEAGPDQRTPNIASIIQEVVSRPGWASGNSLVILFSGNGERTAESFDSGEVAPLLRVEFATEPPVNGDNLVDNPSFETDIGGWRRYNGATIQRIADGLNSDFSLEITGPASTATHGLNDRPNWVASTPAEGTQYRVTAWVKSNQSTSGILLKIREYLNGAQLGRSTKSNIVALSPDWQMVTVDHVARGAGSTLDLKVLNDDPAGPEEVFQIDEISIIIVP